MKFIIYFAILFAFAFGVVLTADAQEKQKATVKINNKKKFSKSKLTVKFLSLVEDSRCPQGVDCIWAGNAQIKVEISNGTTKETFVMNTNTGPKGASFSGFAIYLTELTPYPKANVKYAANAYKATFEILRLSR